MSDIRAARTIAVLLLAQTIIAPIINLRILAPVFAPPGFLPQASQHATGLGIAVLLALVASALMLGTAIAAAPVLRRHGDVLATWVVALATAGFALVAVEQSRILSMLSLSQAYAAAQPANVELYDVLRGVVGSARNWAHYVGLMVAGATFFALFAALFRHALVPRVIAGFGMLAALLQMFSVARPLFGHPVAFALLAPIGIAIIALSGWLLAKGFSE